MAIGMIGSGPKKKMTMGTARPMGVGPVARPNQATPTPRKSVGGASSGLRKPIAKRRPTPPTIGQSKGSTGGGVANSGGAMLPSKKPVVRRRF